MCHMAVGGPPTWPWRAAAASAQRSVGRLGATLAVVAVAVVACGVDSSERPVNPAPTLAAPSTVATTPPTAPPTTVPLSTLPAEPTTVVVATTAAPAATTVTVSAVATNLVLRPDGVGGARFGADAEQVIAYVNGIAGPPTVDSGWVDAAASPFGPCAGPRVRGVEWGQLQLLFGDRTSVSSTPEHFFHYSYGSFTAPTVSPPGLTTATGLGLRSTLGQFRATYPELTVFDDPFYGPGFTVTPGGFSGSLTDATDEGQVLVLYGGVGCGE